MKRVMKTNILAAAAIAVASGAYANCEDGAAIGAGVGMLSGIIGKQPGGSTVARTAIGAGLGYVVCNELQKQKQQLDQGLAGTGATVIDRGDHLVVNFPGGVTFDTGSSYLRENAKYAVSQIAQSLKSFPNTTVEAVGHTDSLGSYETNQELSNNRALSVKSELARYGISPRRVHAYGRGELDPIANNGTYEGRAQNRRVEVLIIPTQG